MSLPTPRYVVTVLDGFSDSPVRKDAKPTSDVYVLDRWYSHRVVWHTGGYCRSASHPKRPTREGRIARGRLEADRLNAGGAA